MNTISIRIGVTALVMATVLSSCATPPASSTNQADKSAPAAVGTSNPKPTTTPAVSAQQEKIANALSAIIPSLGKNATVMDWPEKEGAEMKELRKGTNGWTCLPDYPVSPGNDPVCVDGNGMKWFQAYMSKQDPKITQSGLAYMLQGGSDASNTDPFAEAPPPGQQWMSAPPHVMLLPASKLDTAVYGTDPDRGGPWIMFADTPYQHLMMPVK